MTSLYVIRVHLVAIPKVFIQNQKGMVLKINNETKHFLPDSLTVQALLDLEIPNKQNGIAIAINNTVIPKSNWHLQHLNQTDDILIISATQGG